MQVHAASPAAQEAAEEADKQSAAAEQAVVEQAAEAEAAWEEAERARKALAANATEAERKEVSELEARAEAADDAMLETENLAEACGCFGNRTLIDGGAQFGTAGHPSFHLISQVFGAEIPSKSKGIKSRLSVGTQSPFIPALKRV